MIKRASVNTILVSYSFSFKYIRTYNQLLFQYDSKRMQPVHYQFSKGIVNKNIMDQIRTNTFLLKVS